MSGGPGNGRSRDLLLLWKAAATQSQAKVTHEQDHSEQGRNHTPSAQRRQPLYTALHGGSQLWGNESSELHSYCNDELS